ncbi:MAG: hypothetical protein Q9213_002124 [Squamulea squamosa]
MLPCQYNVIPGKGNPWRPGFFRRAPWLGLSALLGAFAGVVGAVIILYLSDGKPIHSWSVQPTVYLAISSAVTNILLHFALTQAVTVAWWQRALQKDTTIADLHRNWDYGQSLWAALTSGRHFSTIALASILVALVPINGPLLQRASRIQQGHFEQMTDVRVNIVAEIPEGYVTSKKGYQRDTLAVIMRTYLGLRYTGYLSNRAHQPALLSSRFVQIVQEFNQKSPISVNNSGCKGSCDAQITGAGLVSNCSKSDSPFLLGDDLPESASDEERQNAVDQMIRGTDIFGTYLSWFGGPQMTSEIFSLGVQYKGTTDCVGTLVVRNCTFRPATVTYPIVINGNSSSVSLAAGTTMSDDKLVGTVSVPSTAEGTLDSSFNMSTYGGFFKSISDTYESTVHMNFGAIGYQIFNEGAISSRYVNASGRLRSLNCSMAFRDPTEDIIADFRELMFRTAIASAQPLNEQHVTAHESFETAVYVSSYRFLALAVLFSLLGWFATIPVFTKWWYLGRTVTLSPVEVAKAFGAPGLHTVDSNADAKRILKEIGDREIRYGVMVTADRFNERARLTMGEPERTRMPNAGEKFTN